MIDLKLLDESESIELELEQNSKGGTKNYNELDNKPKINGVELQGNLTLEDLGIILNAVKNVLINGASVVDKNGVANIPIADTVNKLGLVKWKSGYGIKTIQDGVLQIDSAQLAHIDARTKGAYPIIAERLPYGVKSAMTSTTDAEWTPQEKANARLRLGEEWRYIGKMETAEDVARMSMNLDSKGQPFNLRKVRVKVVNYPNSSDLTTQIRLCFNGKTQDIFHDSTMMTGVKSTDTMKVCEVVVEKICNYLFPISVYTSLNNANASEILVTTTGISYRHTLNEIDGYINQIELYTWTNAIGKGAYFEVWGVDA